MKSLKFLLIALSVIGSFFPIFAQAKERTKRPNIIFILTDDQRFDSLGLTGDPVVQTPNIDRLASEGTFFNNGIVNSSICTPSRACYFLGQYERKHGLNFNSGTALSEDAWNNSYPMHLRDAGYFTGYVGKNHVPIGKEGGLSGIMEKSFDFWYAGHGHIQFYPKERHAIFDYAKPDTQTEIIQEGVLSFLDDEKKFIHGAGAFLKSRPHNQPFCLTMALNLPHGSSTSRMEQRDSDPEMYKSLYRDQIEDLPLSPLYIKRSEIKEPKVPADVWYTEFRQTGYDYVDSPEPLRERKVRKYQTITGIDQMIGQLRQKLEELGIADNTVILFSSDHGIMEGEFGLGGKALNYEACLKVPMIVFDPRINDDLRTSESDALLESVDFAPSILDFAGIKKPDTMQGESFVSLLQWQANPSKPWRQISYAENLWTNYFGNPIIETVRTKRWKYNRYYANNRETFSNVTKKNLYDVQPNHAEAYRVNLTASIKGKQPDFIELFDLKNDPDETTNLASSAQHKETLAILDSECDRLVFAAKDGVNSEPLTVTLEGPAELNRHKQY